MRSLESRSAFLLIAALTLAFPSASTPRVFSTVDTALAAAFPACDVERTTVFLTGRQEEQASTLAGMPIASAIVHPYEATCDGKPGGTAYFDAHRVRTLPETLLIVVDPEGSVGKIEILSFDEPEEYIPRSIWYRQFEGESLDDDLSLGLGIDGVTGATLTARATTEAVRRVLALHQTLEKASR